MKIIDRFTRDRISRFVWGGLTVVCVAVMLLANQAQQRSLDRVVSQAEDRALLYANTLIYGGLTGPDVSDPEGLDGPKYRELYVDIQASMFTDPRNARVRMYQPDGTLIFSTDERFRIGELRVIDDPDIIAASNGDVVTRRTTAPFAFSTTGERQRTDLLQTFVPLRTPDRVAVLGAVEIDQFYDELKEGAQSPWREIQILFLILALFCGVMTVLSFRRPLASVGTLPGDQGPADDRVGDDRRKTAKTAKTATVSAPDGPDPRVDELERELAATKAKLAESQDRVGQASEAYRRLESKLKETPAAAPVASAAEVAMIADLERRVAAAESRAAEAEKTVKDLREAARRPAEPKPQPQPARAVQPEAQPEPVAVPAPPPATAREPAHAPAAPPTPTGGDEAEDDEMAAKLSPAANDLRARLARTAALKKLGHDHVPEDEGGA
jgi:uncharacterized coiled-coil protein SlyX